MNNLFNFLSEEELLSEFPDNTPITDEEIIAITEKVEELSQQYLLESHNTFQHLLEAKGTHIKGRPGLAVHPQGVKGSAHQKPYTRHQWEKSLNDVNKSKHAANMFQKAEKMGKKGKSGEEVGAALTKHQKTVTKGKKSAGLDKVIENHQALNSLLDKRPDIRDSMLKQLDKFHKAGKEDAAKGDTAWLDASERAIAMVGGDLAPHHGDNSKVKARLDDLARFKNVKTAVVHNAIMNKLLDSHGIPKEYFNDPAGWEAKNGKLADSLSEPHPGENVSPKIPSYAKTKASADKAHNTEKLDAGMSKALDVIASFMGDRGKNVSKDELLKQITGKKSKSETFTPKDELKKAVETHTQEKAVTDTKVAHLEKQNAALQTQLDATNKILQQNTEMMANMNKLLTHLVTNVQVPSQGKAPSIPSSPEDATAQAAVSKRQEQKKKVGAEEQKGATQEKTKAETKKKSLEKAKEDNQQKKAIEKSINKHNKKKATKSAIEAKQKEKAQQKTEVKPKKKEAVATNATEKKPTTSPEKVAASLSGNQNKIEAPEDFASMLTSLGKFSTYAQKLADGTLHEKYTLSHTFKGKDGKERTLTYLNTKKIGEETGGDATQVMAFNEKSMKFEGKHVESKGAKTLTKHFPIVVTEGKNRTIGFVNGTEAAQGTYYSPAAHGGTNKQAGLHQALTGEKPDKKTQKEQEKLKVVDALLPMRDRSGKHTGTGIKIKLSEQPSKSNLDTTQKHNPAQSVSELTALGLSPEDANHIATKGLATKHGMESGLHMYLDSSGHIAPELKLKEGESIDLSLPEHKETRKRIAQVAEDAHASALDSIKSLKKLAGDVAANWVGVSPYVIHKEYHQFMDYKGGKYGTHPDSQNPNSEVDAGKIGHMKRSLVEQAQQSLGLHAHLQEMLKNNVATPRLKMRPKNEADTAPNYLSKGQEAYDSTGGKNTPGSMKGLQHEQFSELQAPYKKADAEIKTIEAKRLEEKKAQQAVGKKELESIHKETTPEKKPPENPVHAAITKKAAETPKAEPKKEEPKVNILDKLTKEPHEGASKEEKAFYDGKLDFDDSEAVNPVEVGMGGVNFKKGGVAGNTYKVKIEGDGYGYTKPASEDNIATKQGPHRALQMDESAFRQSEREVLTSDIGKVLGVVGDDNLMPATVMKEEGNGWTKGKASVQKEVKGFKDMVDVALPAVNEAVQKVKEAGAKKGTSEADMKGKISEARFKARGDAYAKALSGVTHDELGSAIAFDEIMGATDRNPGNFGVDGKGKLKLVDNGLNFGKHANDNALGGMDLGSVLHASKEMRGNVSMAINSKGYDSMYKKALENHDTIVSLAKAKGLPQAEVDALSDRIKDQGKKFKANKPDHETVSVPNFGGGSAAGKKQSNNALEVPKSSWD